MQLQSAPIPAPTFLLLGHNSLVTGSYVQAIEQYELAYLQRPDDPIIQLCLGMHMHISLFLFRTCAIPDHSCFE